MTTTVAAPITDQLGGGETPDVPEVPAPPGAAAGATPPAPAGQQQPAPPAGERPPPPAPPRKFTFLPEELTERLNRSKGQARSELITALGFQTEEELRGAIDRLKDHETKALEARRAQQTREEQLTEEKAEALAKAEAAERRASEAEERRLFERQDAIIRSLAGRFIDPDFVDAVVAHYGTNVIARMSDSAAAAIKRADVERWFTEYSKSHPKVARGAPAPPPPKTRVAGTNGTAPDGAPPATRGAAGAEQPGSAVPAGAGEFDGMKASKSEYKAYLQKLGLRSPI
jgi:PAS domain-containing protein